MNAKRIWFVIPATILPYISLIAALTIIFSSRNTISKFIMERMFNGNTWNLIAAVLVFAIIAVILSVLCFVFSTKKNWCAYSLARTAMIIKLVQIPAYILNFALGVMFLITLFTIPFALALFLLNCVTLFLTGMLTISSVINSYHNRQISAISAALAIVFQFVFIADVISAILFLNKLSSNKNKHN